MRKYKPIRQMKTVDEIVNSNAKWFELKGSRYSSTRPVMRHKQMLLNLQVNTLLTFLQLGIWECEEINVKGE